MLLTKGAIVDENSINIANTEGNADIIKILELWPSAQVIPVYKESTGRHIDPDDVEGLYKFIGKKGTDYGGKRRNKKSKKNKRKSKKSRKNEKKSIKRRK
jgi:hypothetical protein